MNTHLLFTAMGLLWGCSLLGQEAKPLLSPTLFKISPQHFGVNTLQIGTEHFNSTLSKSLAIDLGIRHHGQFLNTEDLVERGVDVGFQYRTYVRALRYFVTTRKRTLVQGIYAGPFVNAGMVRSRQVTGYYTSSFSSSAPPRFEQTITQNDFEDYFFATGFTIGVQRVFWNVLAVDVFAGGGMRWSNIRFLEPQRQQLNTDVTTPGYQGIFPRIGVKIGITL